MPAAPFDINRPRDYNLNLVWDTNTLEWVAMTQPGGASLTEPVSVDDGGSSLTVDGSVGILGTVAVTQSGAWDEVGINDSGNSITVDDGGTSLTVDGPQTDAEERAYQTATGTITGNGQSVTLALNGASGASVNFIDSSFDGTFKFYASCDGGTTYIECQAQNIYGSTGGNTISNAHSATGVTGARIWNFALVGGETHVRVTSVSGSSGSCAVTIKANDAAPGAINLIVCPTEEGDYGRPVGGVVMMTRGGTTGLRALKSSINRYESNFSSLITLNNTVTTNNLYTDTTVNDNAASVLLLAQNLNRVQAFITNTSSAVLYVKLSGSNSASLTSFTYRLVQNATLEVPQYWIGSIYGIWATDPNDGVAVIQEVALV